MMRARLSLAVLFPAFLAEVLAINDAERRATTLPGSIFSTPSSTASASSSSASPALVFEDLTTDTLQTCTSYTFTWIYKGPTLPLMLTVSNLNIPAGLPDPSSDTPSATFTDKRRATPTFSPLPTSTVFAESITNTTDPNSGSFTWAEVNVPEGWYYLYGVIQSAAYVQQSDLFYVENGADTSCVLVGGGSGTTTTSSTGGSATSTGTSSAANSSPSTSSGTGAVIPSGGSSSSSHTGIIVGVVIGVLAIVGAIIAIFFIRRRDKLRGATLLGGGGSGGARYGDSKRGVVAGAAGAGAARRRQSMPPSIIPGDRTSPSHEKTLSNESAAQSTGTINDPFDDSMALEAVHGSGSPPQSTGGAGAMSRTYSYGSSESVSHSNYDYAPSSRRPSIPDASASTSILPPGARRASMSMEGAGSGSSPTYPPSPSPAYPSGASAALSGAGGITTQQPGYHYNPYDDIGASAYNNRSSASSIGGYHQPAQVAGAGAVKAARRGSTGARKTARKPVPAYTYDDSATSNVDDISPGLITPPESNYGNDNNAPSPVGQAQAQGHYMTRTNSQPGKDGLAELSHKKSYGEKQLHVLIPDMPLDAN